MLLYHAVIGALVCVRRRAWPGLQSECKRNGAGLPVIYEQAASQDVSAYKGLDALFVELGFKNRHDTNREGDL